MYRNGPIKNGLKEIFCLSWCFNSIYCSWFGCVINALKTGMCLMNRVLYTKV